MTDDLMRLTKAELVEEFESVTVERNQLRQTLDRERLSKDVDRQEINSLRESNKAARELTRKLYLQNARLTDAMLLLIEDSLGEGPPPKPPIALRDYLQAAIADDDD